MEEIWINIPIKDMNRSNIAIIAISNLGNMKRRNGIIEPISLRQTIGRIFAYRILLEHFKPKTDEDIALGRNQVDHITHNPSDMNVNDIRNLRWCTAKENHNFEEFRKNASHCFKGRKHSEEARRKMSERAKGRKSPRKGCKLSEETRKLISERTKEGLKKYYADRLQ